MENAKEEFLEEAKEGVIKCAIVSLGDYINFPDDEDNKAFLLKVGYDDVAWQEFLNSLDFGYDSGYGGQELYGFIWFEDGTWSERGEYDGSEWWQHKEIPDIPDKLRVVISEHDAE